METIQIFTNTVLGFIGGMSFSFVIFVIIGWYTGKKLNNFELKNPNDDSKPSD